MLPPLTHKLLVATEGKQAQEVGTLVAIKKWHKPVEGERMVSIITATGVHCIVMADEIEAL
jgi:hypothetical protein